jgi:hypothetical protein
MVRPQRILEKVLAGSKTLPFRDFEKLLKLSVSGWIASRGVIEFILIRARTGRCRCNRAEKKRNHTKYVNFLI